MGFYEFYMYSFFAVKSKIEMQIDFLGLGNGASVLKCVWEILKTCECAWIFVLIFTIH